MKTKTENRNPRNNLSNDKKIDKMIETWDIVHCKICGAKISMLNASLVEDGGAFVCKNGNHKR